MIDVSKFPKGSATKLSQYLISQTIFKSKWIRQKAANAGAIADHAAWLTEKFDFKNFLANRETLWKKIVDEISNNNIRGVEFGVAWGYSSAWWISQFDTDTIRWDGFDRFTGLPPTWRDWKQGDFDANGKPPAINQKNVIWHVGDVEDTIGELDTSRKPNETWVILFDLDLYEPTTVAWQKLKPHLQHGDFLYFDESYDRDERHVLDHEVLNSGTFSLVGATPLALALRVETIF